MWHQLIYTNDKLTLLLQIHSFLGLTRVLALFASNPYLVRDNWKKAITCRCRIVSDKQGNVAEDNNQLLSSSFSPSLSLVPKGAPYFLSWTHLETFLTTFPPTFVTASSLTHTADPKQHCSDPPLFSPFRKGRIKLSLQNPTPGNVLTLSSWPVALIKPLEEDLGGWTLPLPELVSNFVYSLGWMKGSVDGCSEWRGPQINTNFVMNEKAISRAFISWIVKDCEGSVLSLVWNFLLKLKLRQCNMPCWSRSLNLDSETKDEKRKCVGPRKITHDWK